MKILQINIIKDKGSTGRTMTEHHRFLLENGVDSYIAYGHGEKPSSNKEYRIAGFFDYYTHNLLARLFGTQGYHSKLSTKRFIHWIKTINPDVIHIRNIRGNCLNNDLFFKFLSTFKGLVVLTTHDFWLLTGGCPLLECDKWKTSCEYNKNCPHYPFEIKGLIKKNFERNKLYFNKIKNLVVQCNSEFTLRMAHDSFLKDKDLQLVYNWINLDNFDFKKCINFKNESAKKSKPRINLVWSSIDDKAPRFKRFIDFANEYQEKYDFYVLGNYDNDYPKKYPYIHFQAKTNDINNLLKFYSFGDVFLNTSFFETFGKVVVESMACGTPAIVFNNGALPELVGDNCGVVLDSKSTNAEIDKAIRSLLAKDKEALQTHCRQRVEQLFSYKTNCEKLLELYKKFTNKK